MAMGAKRRSSTSGGSVMFRNPTHRRGHRSYHRSAEEKNGHPEYEYDGDDYDDDQSVMSYNSMSVRSLPATTKKKIDHVWSSTSMRLGNELGPDHSGPGGRLTVEFRNKRRSGGKRSYQRREEMKLAERILLPRLKHNSRGILRLCQKLLGCNFTKVFDGHGE